MVIIGILVGATYGVLLSRSRRLPWPVRVLVAVGGLTALVLAADRVALSSQGARPWTAGMAAGALVIVLTSVWELTGPLRRGTRSP